MAGPINRAEKLAVQRRLELLESEARDICSAIQQGSDIYVVRGRYSEFKAKLKACRDELNRRRNELSTAETMYWGRPIRSTAASLYARANGSREDIHKTAQEAYANLSLAVSRIKQ